MCTIYHRVYTEHINELNLIFGKFNWKTGISEIRNNLKHDEATNETIFVFRLLVFLFGFSLLFSNDKFIACIKFSVLKSGKISGAVAL